MIYHGDCLEHLRAMSGESVDSVVTDPPAGISFMGKGWDSDKGGRDIWIAWLTEVMTECRRVLKPGAHALVWAIPRTSHWTMTALEDAGFEVRDVVTHLFGTGFPKSLDVSKAIDKEAGAVREVIGFDASKTRPNKEGFAKVTSSITTKGNAGHKDNGATITAPATDSARQWEGWGTALKPACEFWILCRKPLSEPTVAKNVLRHGTGALNIDASRIGEVASGRFPSHLVLDEEAAAALDEQSGVLRAGVAIRSKSGGKNCHSDRPKPAMTDLGYGGEGGASRFFYVAKASKADKGADNTHSTVKSTVLMEYLIRLITPPGGMVLDPFMGSGSTGVAAGRAGFEFVGVEHEPEYLEIAKRRLGATSA